MQTKGDNEVKVSLPETLVNAVNVGDVVNVIVALASPDPIAGHITQVAPLAAESNAYPVTIVLEKDAPNIRPGMSAQAIFRFRNSDESIDAFSIPMSAIKPDAGSEGGEVFVFKDGRLSARRVSVTNLRDNVLHVTGDINSGDIIATAGVSLLYEGMPARLLDPSMLQ